MSNNNYAKIGVVLMIITIFANYNIGGLYVSNILSFLYILICFLGLRSKNKISIIFLLFLLISVNLFYLLDPGINYLPEAIKIITLIIGVSVISKKISTDSLVQSFKLIPFIFLFFVSITILSGVNLFTYGGRFALQGFGSSNTLALIIALNLGLLHFSDYNNKLHWFKWLAILSYIVLLLLTYSRGGMFAYAFGLFMVYRNELKELVFYGFIGALVFLLIPIIFDFSSLMNQSNIFERFNIISDISESGGSGRFFLWAILINDLISNPTNLFTGFGPGSVNVVIQTSAVDIEFYSAHSIFLSTLYYYGIIGFVIFVYYLIKFYFSKIRESKFRKLKEYIFYVFILISIVDATILAAQALFLLLIYISIFFSKPETKLHLAIRNVNAK